MAEFTTTKKTTTKKKNTAVAEEVKADAAKVKISEEKPAEEVKKAYSAEEIAKVIQTDEAQSIIQAIVAKALADQQKTQTIITVPAKDETVYLLYMGVVAEGSTVFLGDKLGEIQGRGGTRDIPKREFMQNITPAVLKRLKDRRLIVLDGFTDDERERYGVKYTDGELLSPTIYQKLFTYSEDKICEIFYKACKKHKEIIVTLMIDAYMAGNKKVTQSLVERLNTISKETDPEGMFKAILKDMAMNLSNR